MDVHHTHHPLPGLPAPEGAHRLAWSYLLDAACADAHHAGIALLDAALPPTFAAELNARSGFPQAPAYPTGARASLGIGPPPADVARHYRLCFGPLAPARLRAAAGGEDAFAGFERTESLYVYTLRSRLLGVPMRVLNLLDLPQPADRALIALRYAFASRRATPAYYRLETWCRADRTASVQSR